MGEFNILFDNRVSARSHIKLIASFEHDGNVTECDVIDLSPQGLGIKVNGSLATGDAINIVFGDHVLPSKVVWTDGNKVGLYFDELPDVDSRYIKWLCRINGEVHAMSQENQMANYGTKVYTLKAETKEDMGLLELFLVSLRKNCKGFLKAVPIHNCFFQVEIYDCQSCVSSFESQLLFWKAGDLLVK
jgi:hypothetical protein